MESERVVGVALQGTDAVVMRAPRVSLIAICEQRMGADFDEGRVVLGPAAATAWLNRTGLRRLAAQ